MEIYFGISEKRNTGTDVLMMIIPINADLIFLDFKQNARHFPNWRVFFYLNRQEKEWPLTYT